MLNRSNSFMQIILLLKDESIEKFIIELRLLNVETQERKEREI